MVKVQVKLRNPLFAGVLRYLKVHYILKNLHVTFFHQDKIISELKMMKKKRQK